MPLSFENHQPQKTITKVRNQKQDLIEQIISATTGTDKQKRELAKRIAITAQVLGWETSELHALLQKRTDPKIRNYTAFVHWSIKIKSS